MIVKGENDIHQRENPNAGITVRKNCFNEINRNYPEAEAIRIGLNTVPDNVRDTNKYVNRLNVERKKNNVITNENNRPDFSDLGIGRD